MWLGGQRHAPTALPSGETRYPLYRRLSWHQGRSGRVRKIKPPPAFEPQTVQPVASRHIDWAIPAHLVTRSSGILQHVTRWFVPEGLLQRGGREPFIPYERRNDILHIIENMTFSLWAHKRCGSYRLTVCYIGSVVTQHIKSVACHNWLHLATCFGRYPAIIMPTRMAR
jgi:hypothetical protein